jgi:hypothetical protein
MWGYLVSSETKYSRDNLRPLQLASSLDLRHGDVELANRRRPSQPHGHVKSFFPNLVPRSLTG